MILSGRLVCKSKSFRAAGFADITERVNVKWVENKLWLPGSCSRSHTQKSSTLCYRFKRVLPDWLRKSFSHTNETF